MRSLLLLLFRRILWFLNVLLLLDGLEMGDVYLTPRGIYVNVGNWLEYLMSSNSPSGGMKDIVLSESNFPSFTH